MRKLFLFCLLIITHNGFTQSVFYYDLKKDLIIGSAALGLSVSSFFINNSANNASIDAVLHRENVNIFDRGLMYEYNRPLSIAGDVAVYGAVALPLLSLAGNYRDIDAWAVYGIMYAESVLFLFGITEIVKNSYPRYRPYNYFGDIPAGQESEYYKSLASRHSAFAFNSAGFLTFTFFSEYPDSSWKIPLCAAAYSLAAAISASRIFSGNHFISDVLTGAIIGSATGYLIPWLHIRKKNDNITLTPLPNGFLVKVNLPN
ncbi:MAG: phosphatase PAP2 family protein [Treponema sp.]|nr:phosphatase PAP2 family protein [Treponema sp.]